MERAYLWLRVHDNCLPKAGKKYIKQGYELVIEGELTTPRSRCEYCGEVLDKVAAEKEIALNKKKNAARVELWRRQAAAQLEEEKELVLLGLK
jgi:uncharacterized protein with PIN domain